MTAQQKQTMSKIFGYISIAGVVAVQLLNLHISYPHVITVILSGIAWLATNPQAKAIESDL